MEFCVTLDGELPFLVGDSQIKQPLYPNRFSVEITCTVEGLPHDLVNMVDGIADIVACHLCE